MSDILPIFYCNSSSKSILTSWLPSECSPGGVKSIIALAKEANLSKITVVSNNFHNFVELNDNCKKEKIQLCWGLEILMCPNNLDHSEESVKSNFKIIIWMKNDKAYFDLIKLYSGFKANKEAKYYEYRCDFATLSKYWNKNNLLLSHPFFDNFLAVNSLIHGANIVPDFPEEGVFFDEIDTEHPHEEIIRSAIKLYARDKIQTIPVKSIYYDKKSDAKAWITYRAILNRGTFSNPGLEFCCSDNFCFESWKELVK